MATLNKTANILSEERKFLLQFINDGDKSTSQSEIIKSNKELLSAFFQSNNFSKLPSDLRNELKSYIGNAVGVSNDGAATTFSNTLREISLRLAGLAAIKSINAALRESKTLDYFNSQRLKVAEDSKKFIGYDVKNAKTIETFKQFVDKKTFNLYNFWDIQFNHLSLLRI
jgi:hypothetical protein